MNSLTIRSLVICAFGAATIAGCATSQSSPPVASAQRSVESGKVTAVEAAAVTDQTMAGSSSGSSVVGTTASGGASVITVLFNDGKEGRYLIENPAGTHKVGEPVYVITDGDQTTIARR